MRKKITILGSTGSIGKNTIEVINNHPDNFEIIALTARSDAKTLAAQANAFQPKFIAIEDEKKLSELKSYKNTHDKVWELTFETENDCRSSVFDFAQENGLKTLQLNLKSKNLEEIFREKTSEKG